MKMGTIARIANLCVLIVVAILLAGPAFGLVKDLGNGGVSGAVEMGIEAVYELDTMDASYLEMNFEYALDASKGNPTVEYDGNSIELTRKNVKETAITVKNSGADIAIVKNPSGDIVIQNYIMYGNPLVQGVIVGVKAGGLTDGLSAESTLEYVGKDVSIPVAGKTTSKDGRLNIGLEIPVICDALVNAVSGDVILSLDMGYMSSVTILADVKYISYESTYTVTGINHGFVVTVTGSDNYEDMTMQLGADVTVVIADTADGYTMTFTSQYGSVKDGISRYIKDDGLKLKNETGTMTYEMDRTSAEKMLELIAILEGEVA